MPQLGIEFWIQIIVYALSFGTAFGMFKTKIDYIEKKLDKHNNFIERVFKVEESTKSAHHRIDELRDDFKEEK